MRAVLGDYPRGGNGPGTPDLMSSVFGGSEKELKKGRGVSPWVKKDRD